MNYIVANRDNDLGFTPLDCSLCHTNFNKVYPVCEDSEPRFAIALLKTMEGYSYRDLLKKTVMTTVHFVDADVDVGDEEQRIKTKTVPMEGLMRDYPLGSRPRFFSQGFIFVDRDRKPMTLMRMFDFEAFCKALEEKSRPEQDYKKTFEYQHIKTACETRDEIIKAGGFHPILDGQLFIPEIKQPL